MFKKAVVSSLLLGSLAFTSSADAAYIETSGTLSLLRVNDVGTGYGPSSDFIDVEVVLQFSNQPGKSFGFQLRNDANRATREAMLDLLRDAYVNNYKVTINVELPAGKNNGVLNRVWITK